jgi:hypothetical protein
MGDVGDDGGGPGQQPVPAGPARQAAAEEPNPPNVDWAAFRAFEAWRAAQLGPNAQPLPGQAALAAIPAPAPAPVEAAPPWASRMVADILRNQQLMDGGHSFHNQVNAIVHGGLQAILSMDPGNSGRWREIGVVYV